MTKRTLVLGLATASAILLAACGDGDDSGSAGDRRSTMTSSMPISQASSTAAPTGTAAPGPRNEVDLQFAADMIPHHSQALYMAELAAEQASTVAVKELAAKIATAQLLEIAQMSGWLAGWGEPVPAPTYAPAMAGHDMPGMMTGEDMTALAHAAGAEFDRLWLTQMIEHHVGAINMAKSELTYGKNPEVKKLAREITRSQSAEISRMKRLLASLPE